MAKTIIRGSVTLSSKKCTVTISSTEPLNPTEYTLWIDTENNNVLKRWENGRWVTINDKKAVIEYIHEELENKYYDKTTTNDLIKQIVGEVKITTDGKVSSDFKSLTTRIEESNSSFEQRSDEIASTVKSLKSTVGGEVYTSTPTVPYSEKDIWVDTDSSNNVTIKLCKKARTKDEVFHEADWEAIGDEKLDSYGMICTSAYSKVRQLSDKIDLLVSVDGKTSEISITEDFVKVISENINFDGVATFTNSVKSVVDSNYSLGMLDKITSTGSTTIDGEEIYSANEEKNLYARLKGGSLDLFGGEDDTKITLNIKDGIHIDKTFDDVSIELREWGYDCHDSKRYFRASNSAIMLGWYYEAVNSAYVDTVIGKGYITLFSASTAHIGMSNNGSYSMDYNKITQNTSPFFEVNSSGMYVRTGTYLGNLTVNGTTIVNGATTVNGKITVKNNATYKKDIYFEYDNQVSKSEISNTGLCVKNVDDYFSSEYKVQYTADGVELYSVLDNKSVVGSFGYYENGHHCFSMLQVDFIETDSSIECGGSLTVKGSTTLNNSLTVSGATTLNSSLTVNGDTTHKSRIEIKYDNGTISNEISNLGMCFTYIGQVYSTSYFAEKMQIKNRAGNVVGSFGHYNDYWSSKLQAEYIEATYEIQCGNQFRFKNSIYDAFYLELSAKYRDTESDLTSNPFPYLQFKQYSNILRVSPSIMNNGNHHGCCLGSSSIPFLEVRADNFYNSAGTSISSDKKVKKDILDIDDNFVNSLIDSISAKTYKYINGSSNRTHCGAIAQDIEDIIVGMGLTTQDFGGIVKNYKTIEVEKEDGSSELETDYESEPDYYLRYEEFIMPLVRYCQLLKQRIEVLEKTLIKDEESETKEAVEVEETVKTEEIIETGEQNEN